MDYQEINGWYTTNVIDPDNNQDVWTLMNGTMIPARYMSDVPGFQTADGDIVPSDKVFQWHELGDKMITSTPSEKEVVAVFVPELDILAAGTFRGHFEMEETGERIPVIELFSAYEFNGTDTNMIPWSKVFHWYRLPEMPRVLLVPEDFMIPEDVAIEQEDLPIAYDDDIDHEPPAVEEEFAVEEPYNVEETEEAPTFDEEEPSDESTGTSAIKAASKKEEVAPVMEPVKKNLK